MQPIDENCLVFPDIFAFGFQVRGIETITTYDPSTEEFVVNTPCESAQKYWIGGAANVLTPYKTFELLIACDFNAFHVISLQTFTYHR